mgnify:FL=1|jgi:hypothetical protein
MLLYLYNNMNTLNNTLKGLENVFNKPLNNIYIEAFVVLFLTCYAGLILPTLKLESTEFLRSDLFRIVSVFLIAYLSSHSFTISLVLAVALVMTLNHFNALELNETFGMN